MNVEVGYDGKTFKMSENHLTSTILSTGSHGNATLINVGKMCDIDTYLLIDCGVPYKTLEPYVTSIRSIMITHKHGDHIKVSTIKKILKNRPYIQLYIESAIYDVLNIQHDNVIFVDQVDVSNLMLGNSIITVKPIEGVHSVRVFGYHINIDDFNLLYCTDNSCWDNFYDPTLEYDLMLVEANYDADLLHQYIDELLVKMGDDSIPMEEQYKISSRLKRLESSAHHSTFQDTRHLYSDMCHRDGEVILMHISKDFAGGLHEWLERKK